ncbi:MAG: Nif3-like dinuclear metal center hexameric protein [Gammaproteobacteria bacterium]|nr:Nif3-like dinuclear metal center hexameric protein [Gammaproteobacteria bacterium]
MIFTRDLVTYCNKLLGTELYRDYAPNGLQVEGRPTVSKIVSGVTASQRLIEAAIAAGADLLLVHHGYFWKSESPTLTGIKRQRIKLLLEHDINLLAYHLPLDGHHQLGNNAELGRIWGFTVDGRFGEGANGGLGMMATLNQPLPVTQLAEQIGKSLGRQPFLCSGDRRLVQKVGWCSGGAQDWFEAAIAAGVDAFISGEISEQTVHLARETGVHYIAAGHHATERYGVQALGERLAETFALPHQFIDIDNPI